MIQRGMLLRSKTKTVKDVFGEVVWEVAETGLDAHDKDRPGAKDGVKCVMLGGSGPSARAGYIVYDTEWQIERDIAAGITSVVPPEQRDGLVAMYAKGKAGRGICGSGIEV